MKGYVARAMQAGLAKEGEPSLLDGVECGNVALQRDVVLETGIASMSGDEYTGVYDVVTIDSRYAPKVRQVLIHPDGSFILDRRIRDNGVTQQFIVAAA